MPYKVFISYSREFDLQAAINLQSQLERAGLDVFRDETGIREGDRWLQKLQQAVAQCDCFVLLAGQAGVQRWVAAETEVAMMRHFDEKDENKRLLLFPILLGECPLEQLPPFLRLIQATRWDRESPLDQQLIERIRAKLPPDTEQIPFDGCPFVGLNAYQPDQTRLFFGRQRETLKALSLFDTTSPGKQVKWLEISGNSGSGKSSLMNAGLLPLIEQGWLFARTRIPHWKILGPMMPGEKPVSSLAGVLARAFDQEKANVRELLNKGDNGLADWLSSRRTKDTAFLLVLDQFEELFSIAQPEQRKQFDGMLASALKDEDCPLFLLSTVRADFQDRFDKDLPQLLPVRNEQGYSWMLPLIGDQGLREIIAGPSRLAGLDTSEVTEVILSQAQHEAGALPLIENALEWLWKKKEGNRLIGKLFTDNGGLAGILSQNADQLVRSFGPEAAQQQVLKFLFNLVKPDLERYQHTRKQLALDEAIQFAGGGESGRQLIDRLAGYQLHNGDQPQGSLRLITITDGSVNLIHETLIRRKTQRDEQGKAVGYWPMFWEYIENEKKKAPMRDRLREDAQEWSRHGFWGRRLHAPSWLTCRKLRGLAVLPLEKNYLRAGTVNTSLIGILILSLIVAAVPLEYRQLATLWVITIPERVSLKVNGSTLPDMQKDMFRVQPELSIIESIAAITGKNLKLNQPYSISKYEVTFEQYDDFVLDTFRLKSGELALPDDEGWGRKNRPVINVDWYDAIAYSAWLGKQTGRDCTLPTEDEWEYAARAGSTKEYGIPAATDGSDYGGSDDIAGRGLANCVGCQEGKDRLKKTSPVGDFAPNQWGLHDMHGNVWEWVSNAYDNPENTSKEGDAPRVLRGGSWFDSPHDARVSVRYWVNPGGRDSVIGFRVVCSSPI